MLAAYMWGLDLGGTFQGAGGVGGLLMTRRYWPPYYAMYDGNGNVVGLVHGTNSTTAAQYEYGRFGEVIRATEPLARDTIEF